MNKMQFGGALALSLLLAACGKQDATLENRQGSNTAPAASQAGETYSGAGEVTAIAGDRVTIAHGPVEGIGWPAMTMTFSAERPELLAGLGKGDRVEFAFHMKGGAAIVTSISKR